MQLTTDLHHQYALDRQQRLRAEAAAHRLADLTPARTRFARLLRLVAGRLDPALAGRRPSDAVTERG